MANSVFAHPGSNWRLASLCLASVVLTVGVVFSRLNRKQLDVPVRVDLGKGSPGDLVTGIVPIANTGWHPLTVQGIVASCSCTQLEPRAPFSIEPGQSIDLKVSIRLPADGGGQSATLALKSTDTTCPMQQIRVSATSPIFFRVEPPSISFGPVRQGTEATRSILVASTTGAGFDESSLPTVTVDDPRIEVRRDSELQSQRHVIVVKSDSPVGVLAADVIVQSRDGKNVVRVPVFADIRRSYVVVPSVVWARPTVDEGVDFGCVVKRTDGRPLGTIKDVQCPPGVEFQGIDKRNSGSHNSARLVFRLNHGALKAGNNNRVQIVIDGICFALIGSVT